MERVITLLGLLIVFIGTTSAQTYNECTSELVASLNKITKTQTINYEEEYTWEVDTTDNPVLYLNRRVYKANTEVLWETKRQSIPIHWIDKFELVNPGDGFYLMIGSRNGEDLVFEEKQTFAGIASENKNSLKKSILLGPIATVQLGEVYKSIEKYNTCQKLFPKIVNLEMGQKQQFSFAFEYYDHDFYLEEKNDYGNAVHFDKAGVVRLAPDKIIIEHSGGKTETYTVSSVEVTDAFRIGYKTMINRQLAIFMITYEGDYLTLITIDDRFIYKLNPASLKQE